MIAQQIRSRSRLHVLFAVLFFVLCCARGNAASDCKADLVASLKGYDVEGYLLG